MPHAGGKATTIGNYLFHAIAPVMDDLMAGGCGRNYLTGPSARLIHRAEYC